MHYLLNFILLFSINIINLTFGLTDIQSIYADLREKNESCTFDTCSYHLNEVGKYYRCDCDENCARFGTCCLDSLYIHVARPELKYTCRQVYNGKSSFMVDRCPTNDSVWDRPCSVESDGTGDIFRIVPVTSLLTSVTYKNYFCFRCHEPHDEFINWEVILHKGIYSTHYETLSSEELQSDFDKQMYSLKYEDEKWKASFRNDSILLPLLFIIEIPKEIRPLVRECNPSIISECSDEWTDFEMKEKCQAYMRVRAIEDNYNTIKYKNLHCALCNFEDFDNITCVPPDMFGGGGPVKTVFSFSHLLDINNADGDKVGKIKKCDDDHVWDGFARTCRKLTCALPGYKMKNRKCQPP